MHISEMSLYHQAHESSLWVRVTYFNAYSRQNKSWPLCVHQFAHIHTSFTPDLCLITWSVKCWTWHPVFCIMCPLGDLMVVVEYTLTPDPCSLQKSRHIWMHSPGGTGENYRYPISTATVLTKIHNRQFPNTSHVKIYANLLSEKHQQITQKLIHQHGWKNITARYGLHRKLRMKIHSLAIKVLFKHFVGLDISLHVKPHTF